MNINQSFPSNLNLFRAALDGGVDGGAYNSLPVGKVGADTRPLGAATQRYGLPSVAPDVQASRQSFGGFQNQLALAKEAATRHGEEGLSLRQGLTSFRQERSAQVFGDILNNVISGLQQANAQHAAENGAGAPTLIDQIGVSIQGSLLEQAKGQLTGIFANEFGTALPNLPDAELGSVINGGKGILGLSTGQVIGGLGAAYSAYKLIDNFGQRNPAGGALNGAAAGAYIGSYFLPGFGTAIGGVLGGIVGGIAGLFKSGKHKDQKARDAMRDGLQQLGFVDSKHNLRLASGESYFIGHDGGHRYDNLDGTKRAPYDTDVSNPLTHQTIGWLQPLAAVLTGGDEKLRTDLTGYLVNAALSNATDLESAQKNALALYAQLGVPPEEIVEGLAQIQQTGKLTEWELTAYVGGIQQVLS